MSWSGRAGYRWLSWQPDPSLVLRLLLRLRGSKGALSFVDQSLVSAGNFASGLIVARTLGPAEFGLYVLAIALTWAVIIIQNALTLQPLVINGAALSDADYRRFLRANIPVQAGLIVSCSVLVAIVAVVWEPLQRLALPLVLATGFLQVQEFCRRALYTRGDVRAALLNNALNYDVQVPILLILGLGGHLSLGLAFWIIAFTSLLAALLGVHQLRRFATSETADVWDVARANFRIGRWTTGTAALGALSSHALPAFVVLLAGLTTAAGLGAIRQILGPLNLLIRPLDNYFLARTTRTLATEGSRQVNLALWRAAAATVPLYIPYAVLLVLASPLVLHVFYGPGFEIYADALRVFAVAKIVSLPSHILNVEMKARRLQPYLFAGEVGRSILIYTAGVHLVVQFALVGAGLVILLATVAQLVFFAVVVWRARSAATSISGAGASKLEAYSAA